MQKAFAGLDKILQKVENIQQFLSNLLLMFIMILITIDVIGRNVFNHPFKGAYELTEIGTGLIVFFALAITHRKGDHITIDFLVERFSEKVQHWISVIIEICIAVLLVFMANHVFSNGMRLMERNATTTDLGISVYPFLIIAAITLIIFALTALFKAIYHVRQAVTKE